MKKSGILLILFLITTVLIIFGSGCLDSKEPTSIAEKVPEVNTVYIETRGENITGTIIFTDFQPVDNENILINISDNTINITVPIIESDSTNTINNHKIIEVDLGSKDRFEEGKYNVIINENRDGIFSFEFKDGILHSYGPVYVNEIEITTKGKDIVVKTCYEIGGVDATLDEENKTISDKFDSENNYDIYIPRKIQEWPAGTAKTLPLIGMIEEITIGQKEELADGTYHVNINGKSASFTIKYGIFIGSN